MKEHDSMSENHYHINSEAILTFEEVREILTKLDALEIKFFVVMHDHDHKNETELK